MVIFIINEWIDRSFHDRRKTTSFSSLSLLHSPPPLLGVLNHPMLCAVGVETEKENCNFGRTEDINLICSVVFAINVL